MVKAKFAGKIIAFNQTTKWVLGNESVRYVIIFGVDKFYWRHLENKKSELMGKGPSEGNYLQANIIFNTMKI